ncbi:MAG: amino acid ABC transporter substrate-binding protein, partial [Actinomycetota bacterium]
MKNKSAKIAIVAIATAALGLGLVSSAQSAGKTLWISSDLPKQGGSADQSASTNKAVRLLLKQMGNKAG